MFKPLHARCHGVIAFHHNASRLAARTLGTKAVDMTTCLFEKLTRRNLISTIYPNSPEHRAKISQIFGKSATVYSGIDATGSLHVGHLLPIMNLIHFQRYGHQVIVVIGDATAKVGDPSGHNKEREKFSEADIDKNAINIGKKIRTIFDNHQSLFPHKDASNMKPPLIVRNSTWYKGLDAVDFVSNIFRPVRVGSLLHKKSIAEKLSSQQGMNLSEFCYQVFQAYDWIQLYEHHKCNIQIGGQDQAGNIYTGYDILKKKFQTKDCIGLLTPLITSADGKKLGKSSYTQKNIFLDGTRTSPFELYQFMHRTPDNYVENYLKFFTLYEDQEIEEFIRDNLKNPQDIWFCQRKLADHVCKLVHGEEGLTEAQAMTKKAFQKNVKEAKDS